MKSSFKKVGLTVTGAVCVVALGCSGGNSDIDSSDGVAGASAAGQSMLAGANNGMPGAATIGGSATGGVASDTSGGGSSNESGGDAPGAFSDAGGSMLANGGGGSLPKGGAGVGGALTGSGGKASGAGGKTGSGGSTSSGGKTGSGGSTSSGGKSGSGGSTSSGGGSSGGASSTSTGTPVLPTPQQACAPFTTGKMTILGVQASVWVGTPTADQHGAVLIYWHGTGTNGQEAQSAFGAATIAQITSGGGIVVAPETSTKTGTNTGNGVWYTGDFALADEVVGCASKNLHVDPRRIYTAGYSAGGLQTATMSSARSNYLASVVTFSGGSAGGQATPLQNAANVPPALCAHGGAGNDVFILDFAQASATYEKQVRTRGGFAIDCDDGGTHVDVQKRFKVGPNAWEFLSSHPFKISPEPYAGGLPADFQSYCKIVP